MKTSSLFQNFPIDFVIFLAFGYGAGICIAIFLHPERKDKIIKGLLVIGWYISGPIVGAILYHLLSSKTFKEFVTYGLVTVTICVTISLVVNLKFSKHAEARDRQNNQGILVVSILTQALPFSLFYVLASVIFAGNVPFT